MNLMDGITVVRNTVMLGAFAEAICSYLLTTGTSVVNTHYADSSGGESGLLSIIDLPSSRDLEYSDYPNYPDSEVAERSGATGKPPANMKPSGNETDVDLHNPLSHNGNDGNETEMKVFSSYTPPDWGGYYRSSPNCAPRSALKGDTKCPKTKRSHKLRRRSN